MECDRLTFRQAALHACIADIVALYSLCFFLHSSLAGEIGRGGRQSVTDTLIFSGTLSTPSVCGPAVLIVSPHSLYLRRKHHGGHGETALARCEIAPHN